MLAEGLMALASLAGNTIVAAATTDAWEAARRKFATLLGRGDPDRTKLAERRLDQTREQLGGVTGRELEKAQANLEKTWQVRLADLLEEDPAAEADLRTLVEEIRATLPPTVVSAADHAVAAGRDVKVIASGSGVAAAVIRVGRLAFRGNRATNVVVDFENGIGGWFPAWSENDLTLAHSVMPDSPGHHALALKLVGVRGDNPVGGNNPAAAMLAPKSLRRGLIVTYQVWAPPDAPGSLTVTPFATEKNPRNVGWGNGTTLRPGWNPVTFQWPLRSGSRYQIGLEVEGIPVGWSGTLYLGTISW